MRISKIISIVLHPIFMPIIAFYLSLQLIPNLGFTITNYLTFIYLILIVSTILLPLMSILFLIKKKLVSSLEMRSHKERSLPLFITSLWMIYGHYKLMDILAFTPILKAELISAIILIFIAAVISKYWKISLHMIGIGGVVGVLFSLNFLFGGLSKVIMISILFSGVLGVSRLNEKAHSHAQIYLGFLVGFLVESSGVLFF